MVDVLFLPELEVRDEVMTALFPIMNALRAKGIVCDTDYARRSKKGQDRHAFRLRPRVIVSVGKATATIQREYQAIGGPTRAVPHDQVERVVIEFLERDS
ncbi:MAG: hypothetical protein ABSC36_04460 [Gaiellaceae bacterium]